MKKHLLFPGFTNKCLTFSYDDGVLTDPRLAQILKKHGLKATFNVNSKKLSDENLEFRLSQKEAVETFCDQSFEVAVHGCNHLDLTKLSDKEIIEEIGEDKKLLSQIFSRQIKGMAYSYGAYDDRVVKVVKDCGIKYARTVENSFDFSLPEDWLRLKPTCHHDSEKLFSLAEEFLTENAKPKLFYIWGHSYEFKDNDNWDRIEKFAKKMGNREDIWYATNIEVYSYCKAFEDLQIVDGKIYNPTSTDLYVNYNGNKILLKGGKVVKIN